MNNETNMITLKKHFWHTILVFFCAFSCLQAQLSMPSFFSDEMVLQRDNLIKLWGKATPGEFINISFHTQITLAIADENGDWEGILGALPAGGPYNMTVTSGTEQIQFSNVMMGEVWICAGQSNMERALKLLPNSTNEIQSANWPNLRYYNVAPEMASTPATEMTESTWVVCTPENAQNFSATAYFFARDLLLDLDIPIGIIDITWGGTQINTWISLESLSVYPEFSGTLPPEEVDVLVANIEQQQEEWDQNMEATDIGLQEHWENDIPNWESWPDMLIPRPWEADVLTNKDGSVWFKRKFTLTETQASNDATIRLGKIDDSDQSWINGQLIGSMDHNPWAVREYNVPAATLLSGENILTVRVRDYGFVGGLLGGASDMKIFRDLWQVSLVGDWHYQEGDVNSTPRPISLDPDDYPSLIFNGMVNPLTGLQIAGVCWYQGESDVGNPYHYRDKQVKLIDDWRSKWNIGDFPFIVTQLPYFKQQLSAPTVSSWATLRESQTYALKRENTSIVCLIDTGDPLDIHPPNKFLVGTRLAKAAKQLAYQQNITAQSPQYFLAIPNGDEIHVFFRTFGTSLTSINGNAALQGFAIAGEDGNFVWANAEILNSQSIVVWSPSVPNPLFVRYAWADNPGPLNLFNDEGLPAIPFRTDKLATPWD